MFNDFIERLNSAFVKRFKISKIIEDSVLGRIHLYPAFYFVEGYHLKGYTLYGSFGGHTYFRSNASVLRPAANAAANALGGHLATVTSAAENAFLSNNIFTLIGLTDQVTEGVYQWVTGEPFVFSI